MINHLKTHLPNVYIIVVAVAVSLWFEGINTILRNYIPKNNLNYGILMCVIALAVFYLDDGSLTELYNYNQSSSTSKAPAIISARNYD
tara:strand:- start:245 stop:508 length:264 start_codon:yes stop_codon:yes gene_type:complete